MQRKPVAFWWPFWEGQYLPSILGLCKAFESVLGSLPDGVQEADDYLATLDHANVPEEVLNDADNVAGEIQEHLASVRQLLVNTMCVALWHLVEQQVLELHRRRYLETEGQSDLTNNPNAFEKKCRFSAFKSCLKEEHGGKGLEDLECWKRLEELRLVANTAKHGFGSSATCLYQRRPDLFKKASGDLGVSYFASQTENSEIGTELSLLVADEDLRSYQDAATAFWPEISKLMTPDESPSLDDGTHVSQTSA